MTFLEQLKLDFAAARQLVTTLNGIWCYWKLHKLGKKNQFHKNLIRRTNELN